MRKNLLMGIIGISSLVLFTTGVNAETLDLTNVSTTGQTVTVGEVDVPVYSVDITWGDLSYDYKYNDVTKEYYWREQIECTKLESGSFQYDYNKQNLDIYWDNTCNQEMSYGVYDYDAAVTNGVYYATENGGTIQIVDNSTYAEIVPSVNWTSEDDYDFVNGKFQYEGRIINCTPVEDEADFDSIKELGGKFYLDSSCSTESEESPAYETGKYYYDSHGGTGWKDLTTNVLPDEARQEGAGSGNTTGWYNVKLSLVNDSTKEVTLPTAGDKIGTVTISIDAK